MSFHDVKTATNTLTITNIEGHTQLLHDVIEYLLEKGTRCENTVKVFIWFSPNSVCILEKVCVGYLSVQC